MRHEASAPESLESRGISINTESGISNPETMGATVPKGFPTQTTPVFEQVLSSEEAAALLNVHPKTLQRLARNGEIPGFRIGRLWGFRASILNTWLESKATR
jgi:excisionase family DNA binding protein